jgi:hypothetical protein
MTMLAYCVTKSMRLTVQVEEREGRAWEALVWLTEVPVVT